MQDLVTQGIARIKNAQRASKEYAIFPTNRLLTALVSVLKEKGYLESYTPLESDGKNLMKVSFKTPRKNERAVIKEIAPISKSSLRIYYKADKIPRIKNGYATLIMSTSLGVMTGKEAREKKVGGEAICYVF